MNFDIRIPIGALFFLLGIVLTIWGAVSDPAIYARHSLGINVNLSYGLVLIAVGIVILAIAYAKRNQHKGTGY